MKLILISAAMLTATGCTSMPPATPPTGPCRVDDAMRRRFIGTDFKLTMRDDIQYDSNARTARVLRPDDAATMDIQPDRLNILLDDGGKVNDLRCG
ncbi:hypothetical protein ASG67_06380 [Sphingomonas sp. Leaf339]|uniref:I78 family peptidase inhibitor n=1 Tax=Sphingomonas sp. Leaf339 TaxID=1736343 RepID=UPI0006FDFA61|nr:I78 family peptidase inhibitor [Sphingomonas sp. Leaf339]KQU55744.1 hypothetical protein ASG67_06380 [Sphingomonas sp. Leaf339]